MFGVSLGLDPKFYILGYVNEGTLSYNTQIAVLRCLFQDSKLIAQRWLALDPPTSIEWVKIVKITVRSEKFVYT